MCRRICDNLYEFVYFSVCVAAQIPAASSLRCVVRVFTFGYHFTHDACSRSHSDYYYYFHFVLLLQSLLANTEHVEGICIMRVQHAFYRLSLLLF